MSLVLTKTPDGATPAKALPPWVVALPGRLLSGWTLPFLVVLVWQVAARSGLVSDELLPPPSVILATGLRMLLSGELVHHVGVSGARALAGLALGGTIGLALGLINGLSPLADRLTDTSVQMIRNIPHLALVPLVIVWFGIDESAKLFLVALGVFFPIYANTMLGVRSADPHLIEMATSYGMTRADLFRCVILPGALPAIFVGLRYALGIMWLTLVVAETIAAQSGIGYMAMQAREFMQVDAVLVAILVYALLGKLADAVARGLERRCLSWHPNYRRG